MKIMHIGNVGKIANGVGTVISGVVSEQHRLGHEVMALTARKKIDELPLFTEVHSSADFEKILTDFNPDIFVFHTIFIPEYIRFCRVLKKRRIPYVLQLHGALSHENYRHNHLKKWVALKLCYEKFVKNASKIIYLNEGEYENSVVKYINPEFAFIPNGTLELEIPPVLSESKEKIEFVYLGRIDMHNKGLNELLAAIKILKKQSETDKFHASIYGTGEGSEIESLQHELSDLTGVVDFYGPAYGEKKDEVLRQSDIFILTSRSEGMPMGVLEALSYGLPCILTKATNMVDVIYEHNCGWETELTAESVAKTISKAIRDYKSKAQQYFDCSIEASQEFTWKEIAKKTIELYNSVLLNHA